MFRWPVSALFVAATLWAQQPPTIRVDVRLAQVTVTVKNPSGELVGSLTKDDFELYDNGVRQEVAVFYRQTEQPVSVSLMIDTSGSTAKELKFEIESASKFLHALLAEGNPQDAVALYSFDYDVTLEHDFTHNFAGLERQLKQLRGSAGTSLYEALVYASRRMEAREGRKVLVIVTDGGDTTSHTDLHTAVREAQLADAVAYPVVVLPITNNAGRNTGGENALAFLAQNTGGRTFYPSTGRELDRVFADIISELRTQYVLGFYPHNAPLTKNPFHKLEVRLKSPDLRPSYRQGYYGEVEGGASDEAARPAVSPERKKPEATKKPEGRKRDRQEN